MDQVDEVVPGLDVGASVALADFSGDLIKGAGDEHDERHEIAFAMLDDFKALDGLTGWSRPGLASLLGCRHPDPDQWLSVDVGELAHSHTVVGYIRETTERAAAADVTVRRDSLRLLVPALSVHDANLIAQRETCRSTVRLLKDLFRRARGSTYAVRRVFDDDRILTYVADDVPGEALLLGYDILGPRSRTTVALEREVGRLSVAPLREDEPTVSGSSAAGELAHRALFHDD